MTIPIKSTRREPRVGVVIVTYNSSSDIGRCLESLHSSGVDSIVVFDNNSESLEAVSTKETCRSFGVKFAASAENLGFGAGVNTAFRILNEELLPQDFIWIVNPDTVVDPKCLSGLKHAVVNRGFDLVSPRITTGSRERHASIWFNGGMLDLHAVRTKHRNLGELDMPASGEVSCTFLTGAAIFTRVETWRRLGGFSEDYFLYWEDADLSHRAGALGLRLAVVQHSTVWHAVGGSGDRSGKSSTYYYYMQRNRILFARKMKFGIRLCWGSGLAESLRLTLRPLRQSNRPFSKFLAGLRGLLAGLDLPPVSYKEGLNID